MGIQNRSELAAPLFKTDPYPFYAHLRQEGPVHATVLPNGVRAYLVTRYEDVQAGLKDPRLVKDIRHARQPGLLAHLGLEPHQFNNSNMLRSDPPAHTRLRALAHEAFTPRYVAAMRGHIQEIADTLLDGLQSRGQMDLISDFAFPLPITVICEMLGVPTADMQKFRKWSSDFIASGVLSSETPMPSTEFVHLFRYVKKLVAARHKTPQDDLVSKLLEAEQGSDHFSEMEVVGTTLLLLIAGHETTVNLIGSGMLALLTHPQQLARLQQEPALIKGAVEELLRYVNPVQAVNRYASQDLEIGGVQVPRGAHLMMVVASANHDPSFIPNPQELEVTRPEARHLAFSQGIHYCLGAPLARLEGEIAFSTLLHRLPELRLAVEPQQLAWRAGFEMRGLQDLPLKF